MFPSTLITLVLALACLCTTQVAALPVPRLSGNIILPSVRRSTITRPRFVRRSTPQLHIVAEEDSDKLDMRDPRNWIASASVESSSTTTTISATSHPKRSQGAADEEDQSIFASLVAQDATYLAAHQVQVAVSDSLEPNGVHASLSAAMAIRQIEQRQAEADVKRREQKVVVPASEYGRMDRRRGQA